LAGRNELFGVPARGDASARNDFLQAFKHVGKDSRKVGKESEREKGGNGRAIGDGSLESRGEVGGGVGVPQSSHWGWVTEGTAGDQSPAALAPALGP
jgi:hypothetical protein